MTTLAAARPALAAAPEASPCRPLDHPADRQLLGGLLFQLQRQCGRPPGPAPEASGPPSGATDGATEGSAAGDVLINDPGSDVAATFGSHTQSQTSLARSATTGTLCAGYDDSYHLLTQAAGFSGFSRAAAGAAFTDGGALGADAAGDASLAWRRSDGAFFYAALHTGGLGLWKSADDCLSFSFASLIAAGSSADREQLAADNHPPSPFYGRLYAVYTDFGSGRIVAASSADGLTWSAAVPVSAVGDTVQSAWPAIAPSGDLYVAWVRWQSFPQGPIDIQVARSANGGASFVLVASPLGGGTVPRDAAATASCGRAALAGNIRYLPAPQIAAAADGSLHVVYSRDPDGLDQGDVVDVFYRRSNTGGASWGPELRVNDDATSRDQFSPSLAAGPGRNLTVSWYDRRGDPANVQLDRYARTSFDGGASWGPGLRLSDAASPIRLDPDLPTCYHGDYDAVVAGGPAAGDAVAVAGWSDDRRVQDGHPDADVYAAKIALPLFGDGFESGDTAAWTATAP